MSWIERTFGSVGREFFGPIISAFKQIASDMDAGFKALRPKSLRRELTYWAVAAVVVVVAINWH